LAGRSLAATAIVFAVIITVILFLIGKEIEAGVIVAIVVERVNIQLFDLSGAFIAAFIRAFAIMIR
jgi:hypothetical protein